MTLRPLLHGLSLLLPALLLAGCARDLKVHDFAPGRTGQLRPDPAWTILREQPDAWRVTPHGLEVRVLPGNMWGPENSARNTFVREVPDPVTGPVEVSVQVENTPTEQYEQLDLVWYYADSHQVKIGQERVDGKLCIVMGREEGDQTRTVNILPLDSSIVRLRLQVEGTTIRGSFRTPAMTDWKEAGACAIPAKGSPKVSLQAYQGPAQVERWGRFSDFELRQHSRR